MIKKIVPFLTLFSTFGTLICCALPALMVSLGLGATLVSVLGALPQLIWISEHKVAVFLLAGAMLVLSLVLRLQSSEKACPIEPELARACRMSRKVSTVIFGVSCAIYAAGGFFAFVAPYYMN